MHAPHVLPSRMIMCTCITGRGRRGQQPHRPVLVAGLLGAGSYGTPCAPQPPLFVLVHLQSTSKSEQRGEGTVQSPESQLRLDEPPGERGLWVKEGYDREGMRVEMGVGKAYRGPNLGKIHPRAAGLRSHLGASLRCGRGLTRTCGPHGSASATGRANHSPATEGFAPFSRGGDEARGCGFLGRRG